MKKKPTLPLDLFSEEHLRELGFAKYSGPVPFDELAFPEEPIPPDFEWAWKDPEVRRKYSGKVVAVHHRIVWGVGKSYAKALEDAEQKPGCPPLEELVLVVI